MLLEDIELIKRLKYTYARALDLGRIDDVSALLTEDVTIDFRGATYRFALTGRDQVVTALRAAFHKDLLGSHTMHMPVIDVSEDGTAEGRWTLLDYALNRAEGNKTTVGAAHYYDRYVKQDGVWLIAHSEYDRVYERVYTDEEPGVVFAALAAHVPAV